MAASRHAAVVVAPWRQRQPALSQSGRGRARRRRGLAAGLFLLIAHMLPDAGYIPLQHTAAAHEQRTRRVVACGSEVVAVPCGAPSWGSGGGVQENLAQVLIFCVLAGLLWTELAYVLEYSTSVGLAAGSLFASS